MPKFGNASKLKLMTCDQRLQKICLDAIEVMDFTVLCGHRGQEEQDELFANGKSKLQWPKSKHNKNPSVAVDIAPWPIPDNWGSYDPHQLGRFYALAGVMFAMAAKHKIKLRWGGTWGGIDDKNPSGFFDLPHFEIIEDYNEWE